MRFLQLGFLLILVLAKSVSIAQSLTREQRITIQNHLNIIRNSNEPKDILLLTDKIFQIDSLNTQAIAYRAMAYFNKKDYQSALKNFDLYQQMKPNSSFCVFRANLKFNMGDTAGALIDTYKALSLSGYDPLISDHVALFLGSDKRLVPHFEKVMKLHPKNFMAYAVLGIMKERQKDFSGALEYYNKAIKQIENNPFHGQRIEYRWIYRLKANMDLELKNYWDAIDALSEAILLSPEDPSYFYKGRVKCYLAIGEKNMACGDLNKLKQLGKPANSYRDIICDTALADSKPSKEWLAKIEAEKLYIKGNSFPKRDSAGIKSAISYYSNALELVPDHIYALASRAVSYSLLNYVDKEMADLKKIILINSKVAEAHYHMAIANSDLSNFREALQDAEKAIRLDSTDTEYWVTKASIETQMGDTTRALKDLSLAIEINPFHSRIYFERALLELRFANKDANAALSDNLKAIEIHENMPLLLVYPTYYLNCSMSYNKLKQYEKALEQIDKAISIRPTTGLFYFRSGEIKARMKEMTGACEDWKKAMSLGYNNAEELILYNCK